MEKNIWKIIYIIGIIIIFIWAILLIMNIFQIIKLRENLLEYRTQYTKDLLNNSKSQDIEQFGQCDILVSPYGDIKYCSDMNGWHFDFCNNVEFYTWVCSTKEDVEEKRALYENICISKRNICPENYTCKPSVSAISCYKS